MYNVGIIGHKQGDFHLDERMLDAKINEVLGIIRFQYGKELMLNIDGESGVGQKAAKYAKQTRIKYHLYLPCPVDLFVEFWAEASSLREQYESSAATTILATKYNIESCLERDQKLINDAAFVVCFWEGKKQGRTFNTIKYALKVNKLVLNGLNELKMISNLDLKKRRRV